MQLSALLRDVRTTSVRGRLDHEIRSVTRDSRAAGSDVVFVAVRGATVDGHDFVPGLACAAVVTDHEVDAAPGVTVVTVPDTKVALAALASALHGHPSTAMRVVGVTGTNGKTTVCTVVEQALRALDHKVGRVGTTGNTIDGVPAGGAFTTPEAPELQALLARMRDAGCTEVAMEASSHGLAQHRVDGIVFHTAVFTNLTQDHLDFHGTMEAYQQAKSRLFRELLRPAGGAPRAVLCADDPAWAEMGAPEDRWTYGFASGADLRIERMDASTDGTALTLGTPDGEVTLRSPMVGRHNALNLVAAYGVLRTLGVPVADAARGLAAASGAAGRLERVPDPSGRLLVIVDFAHSDDALANVLPAVRELVSGQVWVVFGAGGDRDRGKRPKMAAVAEALADRVVVTSDNPRTEDPRAIVDQIVAGLEHPERALVEVDRARAIALAIGSAAPGDAVLIAGKGHETYQEIAGIKHPFDDRVVALRALAGGGER
ncbi:MAG: UDP-N-acetylmuramoyl-L-alanyl-D-glutamate--2,6-diaminopimelate ligase [Alphaproteobacteria bacterium]|nr:UDP-N-acetylmuramoyl-L-alanyl-D-glutamate--2,6-diaminopimelate ligase [Alphaproteobacteria bacterium]